MTNYISPAGLMHACSTAVTASAAQAIVNEKFRENVPAWNGFTGEAEKFAAFFRRVLALRGSSGSWKTHERVTYLLFFIHAFQSLEQERVRAQVLSLVSLPLWHALSTGRLQVRAQILEIGAQGPCRICRTSLEAGFRAHDMRDRC
jgi:hypothetical protein